MDAAKNYNKFTSDISFFVAFLCRVVCWPGFLPHCPAARVLYLLFANRQSSRNSFKQALVAFGCLHPPKTLPHEAKYLFQRFVEMMEKNKSKKYAKT